MKYKNKEFCISIKCSQLLLDELKCAYKGKRCLRTAKEFHHWLNDNSFCISKCRKIMGKDWEVADKYGNIVCPVCKKKQSPSWGDKCVHCCEHVHVKLSLIVGEDGRDEMEFTCIRCNSTVFNSKEIVANYMLTKR